MWAAFRWGGSFHEVTLWLTIFFGATDISKVEIKQVFVLSMETEGSYFGQSRWFLANYLRI